jgi:hypothetical protein
MIVSEEVYLQTKCEFKDNKIYKLNDQHFVKIKDELLK